MDGHRVAGQAAVIGLSVLGLLAVVTAGGSAAERDDPTAAAGAARRAAVPPTGFDRNEIAGVAVKVRSIDKINRLMIVQRADGTLMTVEMFPGVAGLDALSKGERVDLDYYPSAVSALEPTGRTAAEGRVIGWENEPPPGRYMTGKVITTAARVSKIDAEAGTIDVMTKDRKPQLLFVRNPTLRKQLERLKPGDQLVVTFTEPVAVGVRIGPPM